jgi:hypothetical protein
VLVRFISVPFRGEAEVTPEALRRSSFLMEGDREAQVGSEQAMI